MSAPPDVFHPDAFASALYSKMKRINPGIDDLEIYEFRYALHNLAPENGDWASVKLVDKEEIEKRISSSDFFDGVQIKPMVDGRIVLDETIVQLARLLFVGLALEEYSEEWVLSHFYFDLRGFFFLTRIVYFTDKVMAHLNSRPFKRFERRQERFERCQALGYKQFREANAEVDRAFIESVETLIAAKGTPIILAIAGPTAAGKTEIVERLCRSFEQAGKTVGSMEIDNFLTDRDYREEKGIHTLGREAIHFELFRRSLEEISQGHKITIPRYDFIYATSSHDLDGNLKLQGVPIEFTPADIVFIEGNFPFLLEEVYPLIGIKVVYLTDDAIRLKRKWKRDIDYRKKYEPTYFRNRYFRNQPLMAEKCYRPQLEVCDLVVDTTGAALWTTAEIAEILTD